jgi:hypothetical protein
VNRAKGGIESVHPLHGPELRALRPLQGNSPYVFVTEAGTPVTPAWFLRMIQRTGKAAKLPFPVHPHMLRHSTATSLRTMGRTAAAALLTHMRHAAAVRRFANPRIVPRSGRFDRPNPIVGGWFALVIGVILGSATGTYREVPVGESGAPCIQCLGAPLAQTTDAGLIFGSALF